MGDLINIRRGTQRADDVHPLQWWVLSEAARKEAAASWKIKHGEILRAQNRRSIPREPLEKLPESTAPIASAMTATVTKFLVQQTMTTTTLDPTNIGTSINKNNASSSTDDIYSKFDWVSLSCVSHPVVDSDGPPCLVDESSDEEEYPGSQNGEIQSESSYADSEDRLQFLIDQYKSDKRSDEESAEEHLQSDETTYRNSAPFTTKSANHHCISCSLPVWQRGYNPRKRHCLLLHVNCSR